VSLVLDASVTLAWIYGAETTDAVRTVFEHIHQGGAWVPGIWRLEVANGLRRGIAQKRITFAFRDEALADLMDLQIAIDSETGVYAWTTTLMLSDRFQLTPYDASYLELAQRHDLPLATLDGELRKGAEAIGVELLGM